MRTILQQRCCNDHKEVDYVHSSKRHVLAIPLAFLVGIIVLGALFTTALPAAHAHGKMLVGAQKSGLPMQQAAANKTWYFAEGSVGNRFNEFLTLFNPNSTMATVTVTYLFQGGSPKVFTHIVNPFSRGTVHVNGDLNVPPAAPQQSISAIVQSNVPIVAERPMYF